MEKEPKYNIGSKGYWVKIFLYILISILVPFATFFSNLTPEVAQSMAWHGWVGNILSCIVSSLITIRAFLDTTSGKIESDREWEEWEADVKKEVQDRISITKGS